MKRSPPAVAAAWHAQCIRCAHPEPPPCALTARVGTEIHAAAAEMGSPRPLRPDCPWAGEEAVTGACLVAMCSGAGWS